MRTDRRLVAAFVAAVLGGLSACGTVNTTHTRPGPGEDAVGVRRDVNDVLGSLAIHATEVRLFRNDAGTMEAQVDVANDGFRYPPGFRCINMNSMSFLITALGS